MDMVISDLFGHSGLIDRAHLGTAKYEVGPPRSKLADHRLTS